MRYLENKNSCWGIFCIIQNTVVLINEHTLAEFVKYWPYFQKHDYHAENFSLI